MKKLILSSVIISSLSLSHGAFAAAQSGDSSTGTATFSGWVSGFSSDSTLIVTGAGGNQDPSAFLGDLTVSEDGTFISKKAIVLESHEYLDPVAPATEKTIGDLNDAKWVVQQVQVAGGLTANQINEISSNLLVEDVYSASNVTAGGTGVIYNEELTASANTIHLKVTNTKALTGDNLTPGTNVIIGVDMVATAI
ncbi:hypothetical protein [Photobacterium damselae]|uniref:hypothetical protein n=1 Tax=Photobacterium damselae TaxID=38293 RepID=UPI0035A99269